MDVGAVRQALPGPALTDIPVPRGKIGPKNHAGSQHQALPGPVCADVNAPLEKIVSKDLLWNQHEVSLLAKVTDANMVNDFRPIAVLPVIYKLYSRVMYMLTETTCRHLVSAQFAFRKYHQAHEVVFIIRQLVEKAVEWKAPHI